MSGNVWEWTRSLWGEDFAKPALGYPYELTDARREDLEASKEVLRVLRGGSFLNSELFLRAALRNWSDPDDRDGGLGFRLVSSRLRS
jgi:formylglycine-generating enzyme required for sulfatase activity